MGDRRLSGRPLEVVLCDCVRRDTKRYGGRTGSPPAPTSAAWCHSCRAELRARDPMTRDLLSSRTRSVIWAPPAIYSRAIKMSYMRFLRSFPRETTKYSLQHHEPSSGYRELRHGRGEQAVRFLRGVGIRIVYTQRLRDSELLHAGGGGESWAFRMHDDGDGEERASCAGATRLAPDFHRHPSSSRSTFK